MEVSSRARGVRRRRPAGARPAWGDRARRTTPAAVFGAEMSCWYEDFARNLAGAGATLSVSVAFLASPIQYPPPVPSGTLYASGACAGCCAS